MRFSKEREKELESDVNFFTLYSKANSISKIADDLQVKIRRPALSLLEESCNFLWCKFQKKVIDIFTRPPSV